MANNFKFTLKLGLGIGLIVIAFFVYQFFLKRSGAPETAEPQLVRIDVSAPADGADEFLNLLLSLQRIELNGAIFADPAFRSLTDWSVPLPDISPGRLNPFTAPSASEAAGHPSRLSPFDTGAVSPPAGGATSTASSTAP